MAVPLLQFVLVHHGDASSPAKPRVLRFSVAGPSDIAPSGPAAQLLVLDARRMNAACLKAAFAETRRLRIQPGFQHGVLVCNVPLLAMVQGAIRAGLHDIIQEPLNARQLTRLLRASNHGQRACAHQVAALAALVRTIDAADRPTTAPSTILARREYALVQRAEQLAHQETRLTLERASLEERERQLRAGTRRLEREFAALQQDADIVRSAHPFPASVTSSASSSPFATATSTASPFTVATTTAGAAPFATDLQAIADQLAERARALDIRERLLKEMETLLAAQFTGASAPQSALW